jgi:membrane associated rhomboid family serine protease
LRRWSSGHPSVTVLLVASLTGAFVAQWILETFPPDQLAQSDWLKSWLALDGAKVVSGDWWQFLTYGLLHAGPLHLLANLLLLYFAGRELEPIIGPRQTAGIFFIGQFVGAAAQLLVLPGPLVGVSAGVAALVCALATTLPELEVDGHVFLVVPLKLRAKTIGLGLALASVIWWFTLAAASAGPAAAFTGCVLGWFYARRLGFGRPFWFQRLLYERRQREARLARMPAEQFMAEEIDPILEKIGRTGLASLTRSERTLLERGREKIAGKAARK